MTTHGDGEPSVWKEGVESAADKEVPVDPPRKLRILCLHGFRTCGKILAGQIERANWSTLIDDIVELVFLDAPWPAKQKDLNVEKKFPDHAQFEWYQSSKDYTDLSGLDESTSLLTDFVSLHGPFDGLLGFSQGGAMASSLVGLMEKGMGPKVQNFRFLIVVGGARSREKPFHPAYDSTIKRPSLHFIGDKDFMKQFSDDLLSAFEDPVVIRHPFAHVVPKLGADEGQIFRDFLLKQLLLSKTAS